MLKYLFAISTPQKNLECRIITLFVYCFTCRSVVMQCGNIHHPNFFLHIFFCVSTVCMQLDGQAFWLSPKIFVMYPLFKPFINKLLLANPSNVRNCHFSAYYVKNIITSRKYVNLCLSLP